MIAALALLACAAGPSAPQRTLTVLAAASLLDAFGDIEQAYEARHPEVDVLIAAAGSQALAAQIRHGIPADIFASADARYAWALEREGLVETPRPFAGNRLALLLSDRMEGPVTLESLPELDSLVLGSDEVPVGRYTRLLLDAAQARYGDAWRQAVEDRVVSREPSVSQAAAKVLMGEADAAIVYATDAVGGRGAALPGDLNPTTACYHAPLRDAGDPELARSWIALVESPAGQALLQARGFQPPPQP